MNQRTVIVESSNFECVPHWLLMDPNITANALRLYLVLRKHRDYDTGECWPGRKRLADLCGLSVKTIDRALNNLSVMGAVTVVSRKKVDGSADSNLYYVHFERGGRDTGDATLGTKTTQGVASETTHEQRPISNQDPSNERPPNPPNAFTEFWKAYPRKKDKGHAEKAFTKAVKHTDPAVIVAGAVQFRQWCEQDRTEPQFIPHASTWLNGNRWEDERDPEQLTNSQAHIALVQSLCEDGNGYPQPDTLQLEG